MTQEFLSIYDAKLAEYLLAVSYLIMFLGFWNYVQGKPAVKKVKAPRTSPVFSFHLPHFTHTHSEVQS